MLPIPPVRNDQPPRKNGGCAFLLRATKNSILAGFLALLVSLSAGEAQAREEVFGFGPSGSPTRVGNGAQYDWESTYDLTSIGGPSNYQPFFTGESSLDDAIWWLSQDQIEPWDTGEWIDSTVAEDHPAVQLPTNNDGSALGAGDNFYFGHRYDRAVNSAKNDFREVSNNLPVGTKIYAGWSNAGLPNGVTFDYEDDIQNATRLPGALNAVPDLTEFDDVVPMGLDAQAVLDAYSWVGYTVDSEGTNTEIRLDMDEDTPELAYTEALYFVELPDGITDRPTGTNPNDGMEDQALTFTWTIDAKGGGKKSDFDTPFGDPNPNPELLNEVVPEPSRALLLGLASILFILRRSRPGVTRHADLIL